MGVTRINVQNELYKGIGLQKIRHMETLNCNNLVKRNFQSQSAFTSDIRDHFMSSHPLATVTVFC